MRLLLDWGKYERTRIQWIGEKRFYNALDNRPFRHFVYSRLRLAKTIGSRDQGCPGTSLLGEAIMSKDGRPDEKYEKKI